MPAPPRRDAPQPPFSRPALPPLPASPKLEAARRALLLALALVPGLAVVLALALAPRPVVAVPAAAPAAPVAPVPPPLVTAVASAPSAASVASAPAAAADDLEAQVARMARIAGCSSPSFAPDDLRLAFVSSQNGVPQVWTVAYDGVRPVEVTHLEDQVGRVEWSPDGRWLAFTVAPGGGMNSQLYLMRPDGQQLIRASEGGKAINRLTRWSHDGRLLLVASSRDGAASIDPFTYEPSTGAWRRVAAGGGSSQLADVSRDGRYGLIERVRQRGDQDVSVVDLASGREALLTPHTPPAAFGTPRFSPDGATVYLGSNADRDRVAFARLRLARAATAGEPPAAAAAGRLPEVVAARDDAELDDFAITEDGHTAALLWNAAGRSELSFLDLDTLAREPGPALPGEIVRDMTFSRNGRLLALTISGSRLPEDVWVLDRANGRLRQITHAPHPGVDLAVLVAPELVRFQAADGLELSGWLYRPPAQAATAASAAQVQAAQGPTAQATPAASLGRQAPGPVVLSFHGGPEGQERPSFNALYQALLARGIGVFAPNVRGSAGFGKRFVNLDNGALRAGAVRDIRAAADYLVREGIAEPGRIGIMGGSYGGYMTMAGLTEFPELFAAGADLFGIVNFETFFAHTEPWMAAISKVEYGDPATQLDMLRALSPIHKLDRVRAPTLVLHGANDTNVPVVEAEQVVKALERRSVPVQYVLFPDEGHGFRKLANRVRANVAIVRWFEAYLVRPAAGGAVAAGGASAGPSRPPGPH
jgi:dipeptidyl aminopeptidase/acylaminoacyl peptidase